MVGEACFVCLEVSPYQTSAHSADTVSINMNHERASMAWAVAIDEGGARLFLFLFLSLSPVTVIAIFHLLGTGQEGQGRRLGRHLRPNHAPHRP